MSNTASAKIASAIGAKSTAAVGQPSNATGLWAQIETALNSAVTGVQGQIDSIKSNAVTPLDSIAGLKSAIGVLNGLDSLSGSVSNTASAKIASAIGTPTTVVNNVTTNATGLWAQIETVLTSKLTELQSLLQTQVTTNTTDIGVLKAAVTELNAVSGATSVSAKIASAIGAKSTAAVGQPSNATGLWAQIETALNSAVTGVQGQIDSIKSNAVTPLDSIAGLKSALSDLTLLVSANDVKQTAALQSAQVALNNAIKVVGLTPVVSVLGGVLADGLLEASEGGLTVRVSLPLAAQANDSLQVSLNGTPLGLALSLSAAQINARFVDLPVSQSAIGAVGDKEISAQISSGNVTGARSGGVYFRSVADLDRTPPGSPVIDAVAGNDLVNFSGNTNLKISGTAEAGAIVTLTSTSGFTQTANATADGKWSVTVADAASAFGQGPETVTAVGRDAAGNLGLAASRTFSVDTLKPIAPSVALAFDSGSLTSDGITNDGRVSVTNLAGDTTWEYSISSGSNWTVGAGTSFTLQPGTYLSGAVRVRQTDAAGNVSDSNGNASQIVVDTTGPNAPTAVTLTPVGGTVVANAVNAGNTHLGISAAITAGQVAGGRLSFTLGRPKSGKSQALPRVTQRSVSRQAMVHPQTWSFKPRLRQVVR